MHELFVAMPLFELVKLLLVRAVSKMTSVRLSSRKSGDEAVVSGSPEVVRKLMLIDISKAHLYALISADVNACVDLPPECHKQCIFVWNETGVEGMGDRLHQEA